MDKSAIISECGKYRYLLRRVWGSEKMVCFIMLNPSTADSFEDDPTIRRCISFAKKWGYGGMYVVNLFAYRATNPRELLSVKDPIGEKNRTYILQYFDASDLVICAWGNYSILKKLFANNPIPYKGIYHPETFCLGFNKNGDPKHPLYLSSETLPQRYS